MDRGASGPVGLETEFTLQDCSTDEQPKTYQIAVDQDGKPLWNEASGPANEQLDRTYELFPAGMGETIDRNGGGYFFSRNCYHGRPGAVLPRPEVKSLTLTGITAKPQRIFEAESASGMKYGYWLAGTKVAKIRIADLTLMNVKDLTGAAVNFKTGSFVGTGEAVVVTGLGFSPDVVLLKTASNVLPTVIRTTGMTTSKTWLGSNSATLISSLDADGFTAGSSVMGGIYFWVAFKQAAGYVKAGTYPGDSTASHLISGVGFQPDVVWVWDAATGDDTAEVVSRHSTHSPDQSVGYHDHITASDEIRTLVSDGFTVGSNTRVNASGHNYYYVAFKALANFCAVGTYNGNGADNRNITGVGFDPEYVIVSRYGTSYSVHRSDKCSGDSSMYFSQTANAADRIQALITDGFQVGADAEVNLGTGTPAYHWVAFRSMSSVTPVFGRPALWDGIWHLPCGPDVAFKRLTTITDDTSDDTWTAATGLYADHFCVVENEIFRAYDEREIAKCSDPDTTVSGNWAKCYDVGQPGEKVTDLVRVGSEVGICTDTSYYRFDKVAVGRSQLDDAKPAEHEDNGKGAFQFGRWTLLPYTAYYRQAGESVLPVGVDRVPLNTPTNVPYQPRLGKHGWTVGLGGWLYNIYGRVTATGTFIMCAQVDERATLGFVWDPLYHTTSAAEPTILFIDSSHRLWWDIGTNLNYIQLGADGSPEGGNFGNPSTDFYYYLPEISAAGALIQLREVEVEVRNGSANLTLLACVYRDGSATPGEVGLNWASNLATVVRRYWAAGTADTCYSARVFIYGSMSGGYTPTLTPPEIRRVKLRAIVMAEQVHEIEVTILVNEGDERSVRQRFDDLRLMPTNGVHLLRHPIRGEVEYVTITQVVPTFVFQAGADQAEAAATVRMQRSDF